jgi:DNA-binding NtrC family response regulator
MKPRILFVDDDPLILLGLQRTLRAMKDVWEMSFVGRAMEALAAMAEGPFEVVVTDMHLEDMHGLRLLAEIKEKYPGTFRMVLSGDGECDVAASDLPVVQRFLAKPCSPEELKRVIREVACTQDDGPIRTTEP